MSDTELPVVPAPTPVSDTTLVPAAAPPPQDTAHHQQARPDPEPPSKAHNIVERWFHDTFHGSIVARDEMVWNFVHSAVADLKKRLGNPAG